MNFNKLIYSNLSNNDSLIENIIDFDPKKNLDSVKINYKENIKSSNTNNYNNNFGIKCNKIDNHSNNDKNLISSNEKIGDNDKENFSNKLHGFNDQIKEKKEENKNMLQSKNSVFFQIFCYYN